MTETLEFDLTLYPEPVLRKVADPVETFDAELKRIVEAMLELMFKSDGVGLAAPQVGLKRRILVLNETGKAEEPERNLVLVNPTLVATAGERTTFEEGCLSFPGIYADVLRPDQCTIEAHDVEGRPFRADYDGFRSRIIQHELDHLEGVLLVDRMSPADKLRHKGALEELVDRYRAKQAAR